MTAVSFRLTLAVLLAAGLTGCGAGSSSGPRTPAEIQDMRLQDVGELYRSYQETFKKPPKSLKDLLKVGDATAPVGHASIREKQVVVRWNVTLPDTAPEPTSPPSDEVLAYIKDVPEKGGAVLTVDRRIRRMTAEEFKAAKLAGKE